MTDVWAVFAVLFGVYLLQCIAWVSSGDIAFRVDRKLRGRPVRRFLSVSREYRLFFLNPLSPLSGAIVFEPLPEIQSDIHGEPRHFASERDAETSAEPRIILREGQKETFRAIERHILAGNVFVYKANSHTFAQVLTKFLEALRRKPQSEWNGIFRHQYKAMLDTTGVSARLSEYRLHSSFLRTATFLVFVSVFGIVPLEIRMFGLSRVWPVLAVYLVLLSACTSWGFLRAQKNLYPAQPEDRWQHALTFALSPLSAIRANDLLLRDLFRAFHPLAVARIIMTEKDFKVAAEKELRQSIYTRKNTGPEGVRPALEALIQDAGLSPDELLKPPLRESPNCRAYCPLCLSQFVIDQGECTDCIGVRLEKYSSTC